MCRFKPSGVGALCHGHVELPSGDEEALKETVAFVGPVAVAIDAGRSSFQHYVSGESPHVLSHQGQMSWAILWNTFRVKHPTAALTLRQKGVCTMLISRC